MEPDSSLCRHGAQESRETLIFDVVSIWTETMLGRHRITKDRALIPADQCARYRKILAECAVVDTESFRQAMITAQDLLIKSKIK